MRVLQSFVALAAFLVFTSCFAAGAQRLPISGQYGTVAYAGTVVRKETPHTYVFVVRDLELTFLPEAKVNSVASITNPTLSLVTTYLAPGATRATRTSRTSAVLHLTLDRNHRTAHVHDLRFVAKKNKVTASTHTILDLTDGRVVWPFASQLKP